MILLSLAFRELRTPYCKTVFKVLNPKDVDPLLSQFTKKYFVHGLAAYHTAYNVRHQQNIIGSILRT